MKQFKIGDRVRVEFPERERKFQHLGGRSNPARIEGRVERDHDGVLNFMMDVRNYQGQWLVLVAWCHPI